MYNRDIHLEKLVILICSLNLVFNHNVMTFLYYFSRGTLSQLSVEHTFL